MAPAGQSQHDSERQRRAEPDPSPLIRGTTERGLLDDVDDLLDEIDQVLEVNAEEFVRGYVQKGGE